MKKLKSVLIVIISLFIFTYLYNYILKEYKIYLYKKHVGGGIEKIDDDLCYKIPKECIKTYHKRNASIKCKKGEIRFLYDNRLNLNNPKFHSTLKSNFELFYNDEGKFLIKKNKQNIVFFELDSISIDNILDNFQSCPQKYKE